MDRILGLSGHISRKQVLSSAHTIIELLVRIGLIEIDDVLKGSYLRFFHGFKLVLVAYAGLTAHDVVHEIIHVAPAFN